VAWAGRSSGMSAPRYTFLGESRMRKHTAELQHAQVQHPDNQPLEGENAQRSCNGSKKETAQLCRTTYTSAAAFHPIPRHSAGLAPQHLLVMVKPPATSEQGGTAAKSSCDQR